jgi:hypothetical protein
MSPRPNLFLCFLGRFLMIVAMVFWLFSHASKPLNPGFYMMFFACMPLGQTFGYVTQVKLRWAERASSSMVKSRQGQPHNWLFSMWLGIGLLTLSQLWQHYFPSRNPTLTMLGAFLFPLSILLDSYLSDLGIERPLRQWHEHRAKQTATAASLAKVQATPTAQPIQQRIGRP